MKRTGKTLTLSGLLPAKRFGSPIFALPEPILEYSNVLDIKRAWKVKDVRCFLKSDALDMGFTQDCLINFRFQLNTDEMPNRNDWYNAGDNRAIAWGTVAYNVSGYTYNPDKGLTLAYTGAGTQLTNDETFLMPDHIIQNKLLLGWSGFGPQAVVEAAGNVYELNYIVELEEYDISPVESIFHNIKSKAQDLEN